MKTYGMMAGEAIGHQLKDRNGFDIGQRSESPWECGQPQT